MPGTGYMVDTAAPALGAARDALHEAYGIDVLEMGSGGSIPLVPMLAETFPGIAVLIWGAGDHRSNSHSVNESVDLGELERMALAEAAVPAEARGARVSCPMAPIDDAPRADGHPAPADASRPATNGSTSWPSYMRTTARREGLELPSAAGSSTRRGRSGGTSRSPTSTWTRWTMERRTIGAGAVACGVRGGERRRRACLRSGTCCWA